ncbi:hypothetical protein JOD17_003329 [Geomicrobium sediminis]|uniref:Uncharacterized protein n=1 Tax=Geomicrobium sediminis TaxID=1347788 RepID=A0ABS2PG48_9BACL|nr:hypothetical protein [Geomicrobium sediminis]
MEQGMVSGRVLVSDSTHLDRQHFTRKTVKIETQSNFDELDEAVTQDREEHGEKPLAKKEKEEWKTVRKRTHPKVEVYV